MGTVRALVMPICVDLPRTAPESRDCSGRPRWASLYAIAGCGIALATAMHGIHPPFLSEAVCQAGAAIATLLALAIWVHANRLALVLDDQCARRTLRAHGIGLRALDHDLW